MDKNSLLADVGIKILGYQNAVTVLVFLCVWVIEASTLRKRLGGDGRKAVLSSFVANTITTAIGAVFVSFNILSFRTLVGFIAVLSTCFILSAVIEGFIVRFWYREAEKKDIAFASIWMNLKSYTLLLLFPIVELFAIILPVYFFLRMHELLNEGMIRSRSREILEKVILIFLSCFVIWMVINGEPIVNYLNSFISK